MIQSFGQFCPLALASETLTQRWTLLILRELAAGSSRFNDIKRGVPRISSTLLKQRLETLIDAGVVERGRGDERGAPAYFLTESGRDLGPVLSGISEWGQRWARDIRPDDLDPGWLVWNIHRRLDTNAMPDGRTIIQILFTNVPASQRNFWLVHENGAVDVCLKPPGIEPNIVMTTSVRALAEVWRGIRDIHAAISAGQIVLTGSKALRQALPRWLLLSVYAPIKSKRKSTNATAAIS